LGVAEVEEVTFFEQTAQAFPTATEYVFPTAGKCCCKSLVGVSESRWYASVQCMKRVSETSKRKLSFTETTPSFYGFTPK